MAMEVASLEARFTANTTGFTAGLNSVTNGMQAASRSISSQLDNMGTQIRGVGTRMMAMGGVATGALGGAVIQAVNFQEAMTNAGAILGNTQEEMADLNREVRGIGAASRFGPQVAAEAFYDIVSGVQDASTHMDILNAAIATAEGGSADLGATTSALIAVMNSYGFSASEAAFASDVMTRTVGMGVLTMDQLASAIPQVTGMANSMGIEFDTLSGMLAFMTTKGISASQSATLLNSAMSTLLNPTAGLATAIGDLGYESGEAMVAALGLDGAYAAIRDYGGGSFAGLITSQEALRAGLILTDESAQEFFENFTAGVDGATEAARKIQMESVAAQWDVLKSSISELAIVIGDVFLPDVDRMLGAITPIIPKITEWVEANPELVRTIGFAAVGVTVFGAALIGLGIALGLAATGIGGLATAFGALKIAMAAATGPIGLLILGATLLYQAWETNFGGIRDTITGFVSSAKQVLAGGLPSILAAVSKYGPQLLQEIIDGLGDLSAWGQREIIDPIVTFLTGSSGDVAGGVSSWSTDLLAEAETILQDVSYEIGRLPGRAGALLTKHLPDIIAGVIDYGPQILAKIVETLGDIAGWIFTNIVSPMASGLIDGAVDIIAAVVDYGPDIRAELARGVGDMAQWVFDNIVMPIAQRLASLGFDASQAVITFGDSLKTGLEDALGDIVAWVRENIVDPVVGEIERIGSAVQDAIESAINLPSQVATSVGNDVAQSAANVVGEGAVKGFLGGALDVIGAVQGALPRQGRYYGDPNNMVVTKNAEIHKDPFRNTGTSYTPGGGASYSGGRGNTIIIEQAYFQTNDLEQLWDQLMGVARNRGSSTSGYNIVVAR